jgi:large subunit ribosomal protein L23
MVDPSHKRYGRKRVRLALEDQFDKYRLAGFFPGDKNEAQAVFLESLAKYRSRIRGEVLQVFDRNVNEWRTRDRVAFMLNEMRLRNLDMNPAGSSTKLYRDFSFTQLLQDWPATIEDVSDEAFKAELEKSGTTVLDKSDHGKINKSLYLARAQRDRPYGLLPIRKQVVGYRVYLPNFTVKLMRNYTPPGQAYDPWIATFRMPIQVTKNDLRSYLKSVYGLDVSFIRTDIYYGKITRNRQTGRKERKAGSANNYKRATVGLYEPFHYPDDEQELRSISWYSGRQSSLYDEFKEYIDLTFYVKYMHDRQIKMNHEFFMRGEKTKTIVKRVSGAIFLSSTKALD